MEIIDRNRQDTKTAKSAEADRRSVYQLVPGIHLALDKPEKT